MYSSIEETSRKEVIEKCYWPLFNLANNGFPIGIEIPAITLEIINNLDPSWVETLSEYIAENKIEFLGSGYSQIIGPLVPAKVNEWNQKLGLEKYRKLLGVSPKVALVNEMAYSSGIVEHYLKSSFRAIIMDWNNPRRFNSKWEKEWRFYPQIAKGVGGIKIPVIWSDSIAFQKFQRYAHGELELNEYVADLEKKRLSSDSFFPLYSNDIEIFDYRPGRYKTEGSLNTESEWERILSLFLELKENRNFQLVFPSQVLEGLTHENGGNEIQLESSGQPIPVKKQEKYNIYRWALTGRDDLGVNTRCFQIYRSFFKEHNSNQDDWKELCYLWSSDFRTHITDKRWGEYLDRLTELEKKHLNNDSLPHEIDVLSDKPRNITKTSVEKTNNKIVIENNKIKVLFNQNKGATIESLFFKDYRMLSLLGRLEHGYFEDISLGADFYSGLSVIEKYKKHKITDLHDVEPVVKSNVAYTSVNTVIEDGGVEFENETRVYENKLTLLKRIIVTKDEYTTIRPLAFVLNPENWDKETLFYKTHLGGMNYETFYLQEVQVRHNEIYSSLISARHGLGITEGKLIIGDKDKSILFEHDQTKSALIPAIVYFTQGNDNFFFRLSYSAMEMDETHRDRLYPMHIESEVSLSIILDDEN
jgi:hypothetical protein